MSSSDSNAIETAPLECSEASSGPQAKDPQWEEAWRDELRKRSHPSGQFESWCDVRKQLRERAAKAPANDVIVFDTSK